MFVPMIFAVAIATATTTPAPVSTSAPSAVSPSPAADLSQLTARFTAFFSDVLAGRAPSQGLADKMQSGLSPAVLSELQQFYAPLGTFQKLMFKAQDAVEGYQRYHYRAVFQNGSRDVLFAVDSSGKIAGFFNEP